MALGFVMGKMTVLTEAMKICVQQKVCNETKTVLLKLNAYATSEERY